MSDDSHQPPSAGLHWGSAAGRAGIPPAGGGFAGESGAACRYRNRSAGGDRFQRFAKRYSRPLYPASKRRRFKVPPELGRRAAPAAAGSRRAKSLALDDNFDDADLLSLPGPGTFSFRKRRERLDWRNLASVHVDKVMRETDVATLQNIMENVAFCDIESEELRGTDSSFVKVFRLAQLIVEYLIYAQEYLIATRRAAVERIHGLESLLDELSESYEKQGLDLAAASKENRVIKKTLYAYQIMSKIPAPTPQPPPPQVYYRCQYCFKSFQSEHFLDSHLTRRHPDQRNYLHPEQPPPPPKPATPQPAPPPVVPAPAPQPAAAAAPPPLPPQQSPEAEKLEQLTAAVDHWTEKMAKAENMLRMEMEKKMEEELLKRQQIIEGRHRQERLMYEEELQKLRSTIQQQISEDRALLLEERRRFDELKNQVSCAPPGRHSNVGVIEDDSGNEAREAKLLSTLEKRQQEALSQAMGKIQENLAAIRESQSASPVDNEARAERDRLALECKIEELKRLIEEERRQRHEQELRNAQLSEAKILRNSNERLIREQEREKAARPVRRHKIVKEEMVQTDNIKKELPAKADTESEEQEEEEEKEKEDEREEQEQDQDDDEEEEEPVRVPVSVPPKPKKAKPKKPPRASKPASFHSLLALMDTHTYSPLPDSPWITSLYPHAQYVISAERAAAEKALEVAVKAQGITLAKVKTEGGRKSIEQALAEERRVNDASKPYLDSLRNYIAEQVDIIASKQVRKRPPLELNAPALPFRVRSSNESLSSQSRGRKASIANKALPDRPPLHTLREKKPILAAARRAPRPPPIDTRPFVYRRNSGAGSSVPMPAKSPGARSTSTIRTVNWDTSESSTSYTESESEEDDSASSAPSDAPASPPEARKRDGGSRLAAALSKGAGGPPARSRRISRDRGSDASASSEDDAPFPRAYASAARDAIGDRARQLGEKVRTAGKNMFDKGKKKDKGNAARRKPAPKSAGGAPPENPHISSSSLHKDLPPPPRPPPNVKKGKPASKDNDESDVEISELSELTDEERTTIKVMPAPKTKVSIATKGQTVLASPLSSAGKELDGILEEVASSDVESTAKVVRADVNDAPRSASSASRKYHDFDFDDDDFDLEVA